MGNNLREIFKFMLTINFTIFAISFMPELNNVQILALAFEVNITRQKLKF